MQKCPNCGEPTARTEDWACQWCGYPLLSRSYKKISKTYKELREERLPKLEPVSQAEPEPEPVPEAEPMPEPEPVPEAKAASKPKRAARPKPKRATKPKSATVQVPEPEPEPVSEPESIPEPEPVTEPEPAPKPKAVPMPVAIELTVEELIAAYATDPEAADAKFINQLINITGVVDRIVSQDTGDIHYITLTNAEVNLLQNVRCMFDREHSSELSQLKQGQTATIQGEYDGSIINLRIKDCVLVH
ncbi:hypothetical protein ACFLT4_03840 [Chloroflexota bacterium]